MTKSANRKAPSSKNRTNKLRESLPQQRETEPDATLSSGTPALTPTSTGTLSPGERSSDSDVSFDSMVASSLKAARPDLTDSEIEEELRAVNF